MQVIVDFVIRVWVGDYTETTHLDAYEFARNRLINLLNSGNPLSLLEKHGHNARIDLAEAKRMNMGI